MSTQSIADVALAWHVRGYTPLPLRTDGSKAPAVAWKAYQAGEVPTTDMLGLFDRDTDGLGLLCGAASGQLEMLELEGRAVAEGVLAHLVDAMDDHGMRTLWDRVAGGYVELTPSGGLHYHYRVAGQARGNTKLARRPATAAELADTPQDRVKVLIETRGEGGFTVIAPSAGRSHPTGRPWTVLAGSMDTIPTLTIDERDALHTIATLLDQMPDTSSPIPHTPGTPTASGERPGDAYNNQATWDDLLLPRGWTKAHGHYGRNRTGWIRPGKKPGTGVSATSGGADDGIDRLYVFSSSTEFPTEEPLSKFRALAILEHNGDNAACARRLAEDGYGASSEPDPALTIAGSLPSNVVPLRPITTAAPMIDGTSAIAVEEPVTSIELARYGQTEDGVSRALVDRLQHALRYCPQRSSWLVWDGTRWAWDEAGVHREHLKAIARQLPDNDVWKQHRKRMLSARGVEGAAKLASTDPRIVVNAHDLDANPWILNTPSGVVDLHTGELRPASPDDLCTRMTAAAYDPEARAPRWEAFLEETFGGDAELIAYLQRLAGYSAAGVVTHHILPFAFGPGGAGKTVFLETVPGVLGEYASTAPAGFLMAGRHDESAIAGLQGARMVVCSEVNERDRFDEAKVKLLTGGDRLRSRFLYGNYFTFTPTHTLWLMGNYQPRVEAGGSSFWRRLRVLPFAHAVPPEKRIEGFADMLRSEEGQGVLAWIIQGATHVLNNKLVEPERVKAATDTYAEEEDHLSRFMEERVMLTSTAREKASDIRSAYTSWCSAEGITASSNQILVRELRTRWGIQATKSNGTRYYAGLTLLSDEAEADDGDPRATHWNLR